MIEVAAALGTALVAGTLGFLFGHFLSWLDKRRVRRL